MKLAGALLVISLLIPSAAHSSEMPSLDLDKHRGKVVIVDFWASWCAPCRQSFPWMSEMSRKYGPNGLVILTVNLDKDPQLADEFLSEFPQIHLPVIHDPSAGLAMKWKVQGMPYSFLLDREGKLRHTHRGFRSGEIAEYERHIAELTRE